MNVVKAIWRWIIATPNRLQIFFDLLLLILSPFVFIMIIGFNTEDLSKDIFIITFIILCYTYITRWISKWFSKGKN
ncbi:hypothetical protein [Providencia rettgeri]|uniref:hypothetical protein n=1 Tax=Providencia rettgeri TaxID=587 RepID=UPI0023AA69B9|nr:hypothetical protein [Providencia rettgeri]ELR5152900.1 hypothetical protein [Providencia rettgeri]